MCVERRSNVIEAADKHINSISYQNVYDIIRVDISPKQTSFTFEYVEHAVFLRYAPLFAVKRSNISKFIHDCLFDLSQSYLISKPFKVDGRRLRNFYAFE